MTALARLVTPARATVVVVLAAVVALAASQLVDYRTVEIGAHRYAGLAGVAGPPERAAATPRSAHGDWVLVIDGAAVAILLCAAWLRRPALTRLLVPLGVAVVVIAFAVDRPDGLKTGRAGLAYQDVQAVLLGGFGAEIAAAGTLALGGFALPLQFRSTASRRKRRAPLSPPSGAARPGPRPPLEPRRAG
jgi:hypothetical protein